MRIGVNRPRVQGLLMLLGSLTILACVSVPVLINLSNANLRSLVESFFGPGGVTGYNPQFILETRTPWKWPTPGPKQMTKNAELSTSAAQHTPYPTLTNVAPNDAPTVTQKATLETKAPPKPQRNIAACDALPYVEMTIGERKVRSDQYGYTCVQYVTIRNTHPEKQIEVIAHAGITNDESPLAGLRIIAPGAQVKDEIWAAYFGFPLHYELADWYVGIFVVPECQWIMDDFVMSDQYSSRIVDLPSLGLAVQPLNFTSCNP
jgi:hypothetical protein